MIFSALPGINPFHRGEGDSTDELERWENGIDVRTGKGWAGGVMAAAKGRRHSPPQITWNIWNNCRRILIKIPHYPKRINRPTKQKRQPAPASSPRFVTVYIFPSGIKKCGWQRGGGKGEDGRPVYKYRVSRAVLGYWNTLFADKGLEYSVQSDNERYFRRIVL